MGIRRMVLAAAILVAPVLAPAQAPTPRGVDCEAFRKNTNGHWTVVKQTTIKIGPTTMTINQSTFGTRKMNIGGVDLDAYLDRACPSGGE
jgi:hypothetical protein